MDARFYPVARRGCLFLMASAVLALSVFSISTKLSAQGLVSADSQTRHAVEEQEQEPVPRTSEVRNDLASFLGPDKVQHTFVSFALAASSSGILLYFQRPPAEVLGVSQALTLSAGVIKELWDEFRPQGSGFSGFDLLWDGVGSLLGSLFMFALFNRSLLE